MPDADEHGEQRLQSLRRRFPLHAPGNGLHRSERDDQRGLPCIAPWTSVPDPSDPVWPVTDANGQGVKSDQAFQTMKNWENAFHDPNWLSIHSLSQVG